VTYADRTLICIVNFNGWRDTVECLNSLFAGEVIGNQDEIIVIDNNSNNDSVYFILALFPNLNIIRIHENVGFGNANNLGFEYALKNDFKYMWLLNNDAIIKKNSLLCLKQYAGKNPHVSIIGSLIFDYPQTTNLQCVGGGKLNKITGVTSNNTIISKEPDFITGASMFLNIGELKSESLFDKNIFMYWEDVDLCLRAKKEKKSIGVALDSVIYHKESASTSKYSHKMDIMFNESFVYFVFKHLPHPTLTIFTNLVGKIARRVQRRQYSNIIFLVKGMIIGWKKWIHSKNAHTIDV